MTNCSTNANLNGSQTSAQAENEDSILYGSDALESLGDRASGPSGSDADNDIASVDDIFSVEIPDEGSSPPVLITGSALESCAFMNAKAASCTFKENTIPADFKINAVSVKDHNGKILSRSDYIYKVVQTQSGPRLEIVYLANEENEKNEVVNLVQENHAPKLFGFKQFSATQNADLIIDYETFQAKANVNDFDGDQLSYELTEMSSGHLTDGVTTLLPGDQLEKGSLWVWRPDTAGTNIIAFKVRAFDGEKYSQAVAVNFEIAAGKEPIVSGVLGKLDMTGINPSTGSAWKTGDKYRLIFITSTKRNAVSTDIEDYNDFAQTTALAAGLGKAKWFAIGSTMAKNAKTNTFTGINDPSAPVLLLDGTTIIANSNSDLWDGNINSAISINENGLVMGKTEVFSGTAGDGTVTSSWPLGGSTEAGTGSSDRKVSDWIEVWRNPSTNENSFYVISEILTVGIH